MKYIALTRTNSAAMNLKLPDSGNYHLVLWNLWALNITGGKGCKYLYTNDLAASTEAQFWGYFSGMQNSTALKMAVFNLDNDGMNYTFNGMSVFSNCTNLEYLRIEGNSAKTTESDISSISTMTGLKKFEITNGGVVYSLPDLSALTQLKEISVTSSRLMYIDGIANCTSLQTLRLSENAIFDLSALENLSNLTYLDLRNNSIQSTGTSITNGYFDNVEILNTLKTTHNKLTTCCLGGNAIDRTSLTWCSF
jgi:Leucine-rich repeat (LRR) protein